MDTMASIRGFVVVTGLAGAGKTSVADPLARSLELPLVSKDSLKEAMFDQMGSRGWQTSKIVSRAADAAITSLARELEGAVIDNFWRPQTARDLLQGASPIVEVFCDCPPGLAFERFRSRARHSGHADDENDASLASFASQAEWFPIRYLGPVVTIDTSLTVDIGAVTARVRSLLEEP
jgi:predicted kinase